MNAFVTGGTGFLGAHVVRKLIEKGAKVKALARKTSDLRNLEGLDLEILYGDITDSGPWGQELRGCDAVFHVAADYRLWVPDPDQMFLTNVAGTRQVLEAAIRCEVGRIVYTSTVGALAYPQEGKCSNEESEPSEADLIGPYKKSKKQAEDLAMQLAAAGHPIVVVNPSTPVGPMDLKPTPTGKIILDFLKGKLPGYVNCGLNLIDVRDCAEGHLLAAEKGKPGERYILGHRNMTLRELLEMVGEAAALVRVAPTCGGRDIVFSDVKRRNDRYGHLESVLKPPRFAIPHWVAYAYAVVDTFVADHITKRPPLAPVVAVKLAAHHMYFDASKAIECLGLPQNPIENALADAVRWFRENGYVK